MTLLVALAGAASLAAIVPALAQSTVPTATAAGGVLDGTYPGIGRYVAGRSCGSTTNFPITMTVAGGVATIRLRGSQGGLRGAVAADGSLDAMRWYGFDGVTETARGRITGTRFVLDYIYDYPAAGHVRCNFIYEGEKRR